MWGTKKRGGLTLVELVVTMAIVAILAVAVELVNVGKNLQRGRDGERKAELESIRQALELYRYDNTGYPCGNGNASSVLASLATTYIPAIPADPANTTKGFYYRYVDAGCSGSVSSGYNLCALLEASGVAGTCGNCDNSPATACNYQVTNP